MSYDIDLRVSDAKGGHYYVFNRNHTSNTARMWREAGCDLANFDGVTARELAGPVGSAIFTMRARPSHYRAMNPENGWGSYETTLAFLSAILDACERWPEAIVGVCR